MSFFRALVLVPVLSACGFSSGLPGDKSASELSPAENKQMCESRVAYLESEVGEQNAKKLECLVVAAVGAVLTGDGEAGCQTAFDECMAEPTRTLGEQCPGESTPKCTATVAELEECVVERTSTIAEKIGDATCKLALNDMTLLLPGPKCQVVAKKGCDGY